MPSRRAFLETFGGAVTGTALTLLGKDMFYDEPSRLVVRHYDVPSFAWEGDDLVVGQISDLHTGGRNVPLDRLNGQICPTINAEQADIHVITGDTQCDTVQVEYMRGSLHEAPEDVVERLTLDPAVPAYAVFGNHDRDWGTASLRRLSQAYARAGILVLQNANTKIEGRYGPYYLVGIDDYSTRDHDLKRAFAGIPRDARVLAITHDPTVFKIMADWRAALVLSGHTHGGQVRLAGRAVHLLPKVPKEYSQGIVSEGDRKMVVSPGIGESGPAVRLNCPPEVSMTRLRAAA